MSEKVNKKIGFNTIIAYGLPGFTFGMAYILSITYLPKYYTDVIGFDIGFLGLLLLLARLWDAINDPLVGMLSDRTRTRWGRRRPWILVNSLLLGLVVIWMLYPPIHWSTTVLEIWFAAILFAFFLIVTGFVIPYLSLGAEISQDYVERTKLFGARGMLMNLGILFVPILLIFLGKHFGGGSIELVRQHYFWVGIVFFAIAAFTAIYCFKFASEQKISENQYPNDGFLSGFKLLRSSPVFRYTVIVYMLQISGITSISVLFLYFVDHYLQSDHGNMLLFAYSLAAIISVPLWVKVIKHFDKHRVMLFSSIVSLILAVGLFITVQPGEALTYGVYSVLFGVFWAPGVSMVLMSMVADTVDLDEHKNGIRREGAHFAITTLLFKFSAAFTTGVIFLVLKYCGYESGADVQEGLVIDTIRYLYLGIPMGTGLISMVMFYFYPLSREQHQAIRDEIDARKKQNKQKNSV